MPPDPLNVSGTVLKGTWVVGAFVAQGGFGAVYRGRHATLGYAVAIKFLKLSTTNEEGARRLLVASFEQEARILAQLPHPAIVRVHDLDVDAEAAGRAWMVMEWLDGEPLDALLQRRFARGERWTPRECLELLRPVMRALGEAHAQGIIHRDIKPANIMVCAERGGRDTTRLLDFGIAKLLNPDRADVLTGNTETTNQMPAISWRYAAPEQAGYKRTGPWTDVHALALVVTEMVSGRWAYGARDAELLALMQRVISPSRPTPGVLGVDVGAWEAVLARALSLDVGVRYGDATAFLAALEESAGKAGPASVTVGARGGIGAMATRRAARVAALFALVVFVLSLALVAVRETPRHAVTQGAVPPPDARAALPDAPQPPPLQSSDASVVAPDVQAARPVAVAPPPSNGPPPRPTRRAPTIPPAGAGGAPTVATTLTRTAEGVARVPPSDAGGSASRRIGLEGGLL